MRRQPLYAAAFFCCLAHLTLLAQQHSHIAGLVQDPSGAAVPDADVTVLSQDNGFRRLARTQSNGWYVVAALQPGAYKVTVRKEGFRTLIRFGVTLNAAQPVRLDFELPLGSVREVVTITGSPPPFNSEDASVGAVIGRPWIDRLPLNGRGLLSLLEFAPGAVVTPATRGEAGQFTVSGQRPNTNYFIVDGVSANTGIAGGGLPAQSTGGALPGMTALGSLHGLASLDALEEFRVQTSTATPEFGRLPGAQVALSTRSGSNELRGSLFSYVRHGALDANNWFANRNGLDPPPLRMSDFGASLGGPLKRNRAFFFLAYEGMRLREPFVSRTATPMQGLRDGSPLWAQRLLNLFPLPNGQDLGPGLAEWYGRHDRHGRFNVPSLRLDYAITDRLTVFARYNGAFSRNEFTSTQVNDLTIQSGSYTVGANLRLSHAAVLDLKVNRTDVKGRSLWRSDAAAPDGSCYLTPITQQLLGSAAHCNYLLRFSVAGVGQAVSGAEPDQGQSQWQILPAAQFAVGAHQLRLGYDSRLYAPERRDRSYALSVIAESLNGLLALPDLWIATAAPQSRRSRLTEFSTFAQDTWRVHPRLTATFGLRWEYARAPRLGGDGSGYAFPDQTEIWHTRRTNFAPRAGLAYRPSSKDTMVVRAGWGLYYVMSPSIATDLINGGPFSLTQYFNPRNAPFSTLLTYGFAPDLRLPAVHQWSLTVDREIAGRDALSIGYVGSSGTDLLRREFSGVDGSQTFWLALATNHGQSSYHGLQAQYRRPMARGVQALATYSWAHSIDNSSSDSLLHRVGPGISAPNDRGASDFDVRHSLTLALTFESAARPHGAFAARLLRGWGVDGILRARSGFPITVLNSEYSLGLGFTNVFRPDLAPGQPVWIADPSSPGGRRLNRAAFQLTGPLDQGNLGRNAVRGFGMNQVDLALRREFKFAERRTLEVRLEGFNVLNHPNFADPARYLSSPLFGESPSPLSFMLGTGSPGSGLTPALQTGGARSLQAALRIRF
ncbi:MAG: TonB-dependent receptor [Bryobacteraceae bacterium]|nr:TonB-dependent receptor [Bryobacteraceae bacterium]